MKIQFKCVSLFINMTVAINKNQKTTYFHLKQNNNIFC